MDGFDNGEHWRALPELANVAPPEKIRKYLLSFDSYQRTEKMAYLMLFAKESKRCLRYS
jgi:hypothetical protein